MGGAYVVTCSVELLGAGGAGPGQGVQVLGPGEPLEQDDRARLGAQRTKAVDVSHRNYPDGERRAQAIVSEINLWASVAYELVSRPIMRIWRLLPQTNILTLITD